MKKFNRIFLLLFSVQLFVSCGAMQKNDRISKRNDFFNKFSKTDLKAKANWKVENNTLVLRKNKSFAYHSKVFGLSNSGYYSGTFEKINDSIFVFDFYNNHKPHFIINDTLKISQKENLEILKNSKAAYLVITKNRL